jgi:hypothetical protein
MISVGDNLLRDDWMEGVETEEPTTLVVGAVVAKDQALLVEH